MKVYLKDNKVSVSCLYAEKDIIKSIGDYRYMKRSQMWRFPLRKLPDIIEKLNVEYDENVKQKYDELLVERAEYEKKVKEAQTIKTAPITRPDPFHPFLLIENSMFEHQIKGFTLAKLFNSYALFMETGTGKTRVAIELCKTRKPAMVVAPLNTLEDVWQEEIEKWSDLSYINLWQNLDGLDEEADIYIVNYEHFKKLLKSGEIKDKIKFLVIDESAKMKNNRSLITKAIIKQGDNVPYRLILTGMPDPEGNLLAYWGQMAFINPDLIGENFYVYRNTYFHSFGYGGYQYTPNPSAKEIIMTQIEKQAYYVKKEDTTDLPEQIFETRSIEMDEMQRTKYEEMRKENVMRFKNHTTLASNELAKIMKLRQVTAGFSITTEGIPVQISDTKLNALKEILEEIGPERQVIIWVQFHWEVSLLAKELGSKATKLYGDMNQRDKIKSIKDFRSGKIQYLIAHPASGGWGLNLMNCSYCVWFSLSYSNEQFGQANARIYRIGQKNTCTYIMLLAKKSIDQVIYRALNKKQKMSEACLAMLKNGGDNGLRRTKSSLFK